MARVREGVEIPIIPEDLEPSEDDLLFEIVKSCLNEPDRNYQDERYAVEWAIVESIFDQRSSK
jgi:hypothetical protein